MKSTIVFTFSAVVYLLRGLGLLFSPETLYGFYGASLDAVGNWSGHFMGGAMLFIATINWFASRDSENSFLPKIIIANIGFEAISIVMALIGAKLFNSLVWAAIGLDTIMFLSFIYLFFNQTAAKQELSK